MPQELRYHFDADEINVFRKSLEKQDYADPFDVMTFLQFETAPLQILFELLDIPWTFIGEADDTMKRIYEYQWSRHGIWDLWTLVGMGLVTAEILDEEVLIKPTEELNAVDDILRSHEFKAWKLAYDRLLATAYAHFSRYGKMHPMTILDASKLKSELDPFTLLVLSSMALRHTPFAPTIEPPGNLPVTEEEVYESRIDLLGLEEFSDTELAKQDHAFLKTLWLRFKQGESVDEIAADMDVQRFLTDLVIWRSTLSPWPSMGADY